MTCTVCLTDTGARIVCYPAAHSASVTDLNEAVRAGLLAPQAPREALAAMRRRRGSAGSVVLAMSRSKPVEAGLAARRGAPPRAEAALVAGLPEGPGAVPEAKEDDVALRSPTREAASARR